MAQIFPTLKPGVTYFVEEISERPVIHIGTEESSLTLYGRNSILVAERCDGSISLKDISIQLNILESELILILQPLIQRGFLSLSSCPALAQSVEDFSQGNSIARSKSELNLISWRGTNNPQIELFRRTLKKIFISGSGNLSSAIYSLLLASGFTKTKTDLNLNRKVQSEQVNGLPFSVSDIGATFKSAFLQKEREIALNLEVFRPELESVTGSDRPQDKFSDLVISTQNLPPEKIQELMVDGVPHLQISNLVKGKIEIGPLVIPGKTPCLNCLEIWKMNQTIEKIRLLARLSQPLELSVAATSFVAGLVVGLVDNFLAQSQSFLIGSSLLLDLNRPLNYLERFWQPHPRCGCLELL